MIRATKQEAEKRGYTFSIMKWRFNLPEDHPLHWRGHKDGKFWYFEPAELDEDIKRTRGQ